MSDDPFSLDEEKWNSPATSSEVARAILQCRINNHAMIRMVTSLMSRDKESYLAAYQEFAKADAELQQLINDIGGLGGRRIDG